MKDVTWTKAGKMKLSLLALGLWLPLSIGSLYLQVAPTQEDYHVLNMTIQCGNLQIEGDFDLEFQNARPYQIWDIEGPVPIHFRSLYIETESISVNGDSLDQVDKTIRIEALGPSTQLRICEPEKPANFIFISRIVAASDYTEMNFFSTSGETYVSIGRNSIINLENYYPKEEWIIKIEGGFQVIGGKSMKSAGFMEDKEIRFSGSLKIEDPELPNSQNIALNFDFSRDVKNLRLNEGRILFKSNVGSNYSSSNTFMVESNGIVSKDEVIEDGFRIDMTKEFYQEERFLREFYIENVRRMNVYSIWAIEDRLSVKTFIEYYGSTLFPKVEIITKYFLVTERESKGDLLVEVSNLETNDEKFIDFLVGKKYLAETYVNKLVKDDILVDFDHVNFQESFRESEITLGFPYTYIFTCFPPSFGKQPISCYTEIRYCRRNEESSLFTDRTESFFAVIRSEILLKIEDYEEGKPFEAKENSKLSFSKKLTLESETSDSIEVHIFLIADEFRIEKLEYDPDYLFKKGDYINIEVELRAPFTKVEKEMYTIKMLVFYRVSGSYEYTLYLPDSTNDVTLVQEIIVRKSFLSYLSGYLSEWSSLITLFLLSSILSYIVLYVFIPRTKYVDILDKLYKTYITEDEAKLKIIKSIVDLLIFIVIFVFFMVFLTLLSYKF